MSKLRWCPHNGYDQSIVCKVCESESKMTKAEMFRAYTNIKTAQANARLPISDFVFIPVDDSIKEPLSGISAGIREVEEKVKVHEKSTLSNTSQIRKDSPVFSGVMMYFPEALMELSRHSKTGNDKHNPGQPLHWEKDKSKDHADCVARHLIDIGPNWNDTDIETGSYHATALAWRALALLQTVLEKEKK
jgi:hypothetical protein